MHIHQSQFVNTLWKLYVYTFWHSICIHLSRHIHTFVVSNSMEPLIPQHENELAKWNHFATLRIGYGLCYNHHLHRKLTFSFPNLIRTWKPLAATAPVVLWTTSGRLNGSGGEDVKTSGEFNQLVGPFRQASPNKIPSKQWPTGGLVVIHWPETCDIAFHLKEGTATIHQKEIKKELCRLSSL